MTLPMAMPENMPRPTDSPLDADRWGRDPGPLSARNTSKGALVVEAHAVFRALAAGTPVSDIHSACLSGRLLRQRTRETRRHIWKALNWRYFAWNPPHWVLAELAEAARGDATDPHFLGLAYVHYARRDCLTFEFVTQKLFVLWRNNTNQVRREDALDFLAECEERHTQIRRWRDSTRKKLAGNVLTALRDFGLLVGVQRKEIRRPVIPPEVVFHLCRLLHGEGLRGLGVLEASDWRLLLWEPHDVASALGSLSQAGRLRFEKSGRTVILQVPEYPSGEDR